MTPHRLERKPAGASSKPSGPRAGRINHDVGTDDAGCGFDADDSSGLHDEVLDAAICAEREPAIARGAQIVREQRVHVDDALRFTPESGVEGIGGEVTEKREPAPRLRRRQDLGRDAVVPQMIAHMPERRHAIGQAQREPAGPSHQIGLIAFDRPELCRRPHRERPDDRVIFRELEEAGVAAGRVHTVGRFALENQAGAFAEVRKRPGGRGAGEPGTDDEISRGLVRRRRHVVTERVLWIATVIMRPLVPILVAAVLAGAPGLSAQTAPRAAVPTLAIAAAARAIAPGEIVVLTITTPEPVDAVQVRAFDQAWPPYRTGSRTWRALLGIDLDVAPRTYPAVVTAGEGASGLSATYSLPVKAKAFATRTLTVDDAFVNPPASVMPRIEAEGARLTAIWRHASPERLWSAAFIAPVPEAANSAFGKRSVMNGQPGSPHSGADFPSPPGEPVKAPNAGRVVLAGDLYYSGNTVLIDHGLGLYSLFAHLSAIDVHEGDAVTPGQFLGKVGATGRVTGPHLHWSVRLGGARVDPLALLALLGAH